MRVTGGEGGGGAGAGAGAGGGVRHDATSSTAAKPLKMRRLGLEPTCRRWIFATQCPQSSRNARRILLLCPMKQSLAPLLWNILMSPAHHLVLRLRGGVQVFVKTLTGKTITLFSFKPSDKTTPPYNNNAFYISACRTGAPASPLNEHLPVLP